MDKYRYKAMSIDRKGTGNDRVFLGVRPHPLINFSRRLTAPPYTPIEVGYAGRSYVFHAPLECHVEVRYGGYCINYESLGIASFGKTMEMARQNFAYDFSELYDRYHSPVYVRESARDIELRHLLDSLVKEVRNWT